MVDMIENIMFTVTEHLCQKSVDMFFPHSWLTTGFVTRVEHEGCHMWSRKCLPFRSTWVLNGVEHLMQIVTEHTRVTNNDHGYVSFVVVTMRSFPHLWLTTGFATRVEHEGCHVWSRNCLPFRSTWVINWVGVARSLVSG
jgi:hypothetical protein